MMQGKCCGVGLFVAVRRLRAMVPRIWLHVLSLLPSPVDRVALNEGTLEGVAVEGTALRTKTKVCLCSRT